MYKQHIRSYPNIIPIWEQEWSPICEVVQDPCGCTIPRESERWSNRRHPTSPYKLVTFICIRTHCSKSVFMIWHELRTMFARNARNIFNLHRFSMSLNVPTLLIFNTMQCQDILHFRSPSSCSGSHPLIVHTSVIVLQPHCWCHVLLCSGHRAICFFLGGNRTRLCSSEVGTWQRWDWIVTFLLRHAVEDRHLKIPAVSSSFYFKLWESPVKIKVHTLHLKGSFKFGSIGFLLPCLT